MRPSVARRSADSPYLTVQLRGVTLLRAGRSVLRDLSWRITPGQRWLLVGANGAGKTQLLKLLAGAIWPTPTPTLRRRKSVLTPPLVPRRYWLHDQRFSTPAEVREQIAYLGAERQDKYVRYQWNFSVFDVIATGALRTDIPLQAPTSAVRARVHALLKRLAIESLVARKFLTLSYGERRLVLLARALAGRPRLLLLDEIGNGLDSTHHARLMRWLNSTRRSLLPWVLTTHRLEEVPAAVTHVAQLIDGRLQVQAVNTRVLARIWPRSVAVRKRRSAAVASAMPQRTVIRGGAPLVQFCHASVYDDGVPILRDLNFTIAAQERWVIHGPNGSGKSTLLRTIYGDHGVAIGGTMTRAGIGPGVSLDHFKRWVGLVAPHLQADHPQHLSVLDVVVSGRYSSIGLAGEPSADDRRHARSALLQFAALELRGRRLNELSYGQLRRVLFARAWVHRPRLVLLDEPFAGLDTQTREDLRQRLDQWLAAGGSCVMATHHRQEWPAGTTHALSLRGGQVVQIARLSAQELNR